MKYYQIEVIFDRKKFTTSDYNEIHLFISVEAENIRLAEQKARIFLEEAISFNIKESSDQIHYISEIEALRAAMTNWHHKLCSKRTGSQYCNCGVDATIADPFTNTAPRIPGGSTW